MFSSIQLRSLLFLDIESVAEASDWKNLTERKQILWQERQGGEVDLLNDTYQKEAALSAEFGKIACISMGLFFRSGRGLRLKVKTFAGEEIQILKTFSSQLNAMSNEGDKGNWELCGHNIRAFTLPFLCKRMLIGGVHIPEIMDLHGLKPWEVPLLDTLQLWKFGDFKGQASLRLIGEVLEIPSAENIMPSDEIHNRYWQEKNLDAIIHKSQMDVATTAQLVLKLKGLPLLSRDEKIFSSEMLK